MPSIDVILTATSTGFSAGLGKARKEADSFMTSLSGLAKKSIAFGTALAGAVTVAKMATASFTAMNDAVKEQFSTLDNLAKTADKLGVTTEALAGLRHAADLSGVSSQNLDMSLQRMTRRLADATPGSPLAKALDEAGLSAQRLQQLSPDQALREIADAMGDLDSPSKKISLAFKLFDSEGAGLVNTLAGGSAGLDAAAAEAEKLGLAVSRVDAAKIEMANDAVTRLSRLIEGVAARIAIELAPYIEGVATTLVELGTEGDLAFQIVSSGIDVVTSSLEVAAHGADRLLVTFMQIAGVAESLGSIFTSLGRKLGLGGASEGALKKQLMKSRLGPLLLLFSPDSPLEPQNILGAPEVGPDPKAEQGPLTAMLDRFKTISQQAAESIERAKKEREQLKQQLVQSTGKGGPSFDFKSMFEGAVERGKGLLGLVGYDSDKAEKLQKEMRSPFEKFQSTITELKQLSNFGLIDENTFAAAAQKAKGELENSLSLPDQQVEKLGTPEALVRGSQAAFSAINRRMNGATNPQEKSARSLAELVKIARAQEQRDRQRSNNVALELATVTF